jgi:Flp pilus assembly protein TadD
MNHPASRVASRLASHIASRIACFCTLLMLAAWLSGIPTAAAESTTTAPPVNSADFDMGADAIKSRDWTRAVYHLDIVAKSELPNADVQNLLGYAYRNQRKFDLAFRHYGEALRIDPSHRGAHEYIGEAYVLTGNKAKAQEHLAALERICGKSCEEYRDLAKALVAAK